MTERSKITIQGLRNEIAAMYSDLSPEMALIRGAHLNAVSRLTPFAMVANIGNGVLVFWAFRERLPLGLWAWWGALSLVSCLALLNWWRHRHQLREAASPRAVRRATLHATVLASVWALMPLIWFPDATLQQQLLIATLLTGMLSAGGFVLSSLPMASFAYVLVYAFAALGAVWRTGDPMMAAMAALVCVYAPMVMIGALYSWRKANALLRSQAEAVRQERMLAILFDDFEQHAGDALWEIDAEGRLTHVSPRLSQFLRIPAGGRQDSPLLALLATRSPEGAVAMANAFAAGRAFRELELTVVDGGVVRHLSVNGKPLLGADGETRGFRGVMADVTEKVVGLRMLQQLAHKDSLTSLANRFTFRDMLTEAVEKGRLGAVFIIDLDHFKAINDTLGHAAGDQLLKAISARLLECVGPDDLVARLGGDEFAILSFDAYQQAAAPALAERVIASLTMPVALQGRRLRVGASVGVALGLGEGATVEELMIQADTALYAAKESGRGRHAVYTAELGEKNRRRALIEAGLRHAIEHDQLALHWQPKVDVVDWRMIGVEGLMRWDHPELGRVNPAEFIAIAEQCGMIEDLGDWALREACRQAVGALAGLTVAVNVSPLQLRDGRLVDRLRALLEEFGVDPSQLELEITESVFIDDAESALALLHGLRGLGVRIALDDFGTGYSSLAYLRRFPFDTLKIDRAFVNEMVESDEARAIIDMIAQLAVTLNMRTVCEGVETPEQLAAVQKAGRHQIQGYLICKPLPIDQLIARRSEWVSAPTIQLKAITARG